jgi:hypothetical protein
VKASFDDPQNYEYHFEPYWKALNVKEDLKLDELQKAYYYLYPKHFPKEEHMSDDDFSGFSYLKKQKSRKMLEGHIAANTSSDAEALANSFMKRKSRTMNS